MKAKRRQDENILVLSFENLSLQKGSGSVSEASSSAGRAASVCSAIQDGNAS